MNVTHDLWFLPQNNTTRTDSPKKANSKIGNHTYLQAVLSLFSLSHVKLLICSVRNVEPMGHSICVIRRNTPRDNPNIVQVQPKCQESEEIPGMSVHLILKQQYHWYSCLDIFFSSLLSLTIMILFGFPHCCSYFRRTRCSAMESLPRGV